MKSSSKPRYNPVLGRVSSLGPTEVWQTALLLPLYWDNLQTAHMTFDRLPSDPWIVCRGMLDGDIDVRFDSRNSPRIVGYLTDGVDRVGFIAFGDTRALTEAMQANSQDLILYGERSVLDNRVWLKNIQLIDEKWLGRLRPRYPGKTKVISPETVRQRVIPLLAQAVPMARKWLLDTLDLPESELLRIAGCDEGEWTLEEILKRAHLPRSLAEGKFAQAALERIAAFGAIKESGRDVSARVQSSLTIPADGWHSWASQIPFQLVKEQDVAIAEILERINTGRPLRHCLSGDVGTGKTAVYATVAATVFAASGRVAIMLPNETLARQAFEDMKAWWPQIPMKFFSGSTLTPREIDEEPFVVGTQALLFKKIGRLDLIVIDEQQKFSRQQREQLVTEDTHLLEVSATAIPRSQALMRFGALSMSKLRKGHVNKTIHTRIWKAENRRALMSDIRDTITEGGKIIVVYPKRKSDEESASPLLSAEDAYLQWDRLFPGMVRLAHGGLDEEMNDSSISDLKQGLASILISTSLVEVGINIPNLRRTVVVHAERFGLSTLHQLRGRAAREGGVGFCDLVLPLPVKEEVEYRLQILCATTDGFDVAEHDMAIRGFGNLSADSDKQSGADDTFLFGRALNPDTLESVLILCDRALG